MTRDTNVEEGDGLDDGAAEPADGLDVVKRDAAEHLQQRSPFAAGQRSGDGVLKMVVQLDLKFEAGQRSAIKARQWTCEEGASEEQQTTNVLAIYKPIQPIEPTEC